MKQNTGHITRPVVIFILLTASVLPCIVSMKFNTAICFVLSAITLFLPYIPVPATHQKKAAFIGACLLFVIAIPTLSRHGGNIWVESELGKGSTFYFTISKTSYDK